MSELVLSERDGALHILTLNRPDRHNAMDDAMSALFRTRLDDALEESESSAILIRAAGKSFCSGRDTQVPGHRARDESDFHFVRRHQEGRLRMQESTNPIVAALKDALLGGGSQPPPAPSHRATDHT